LQQEKLRREYFLGVTAIIIGKLFLLFSSLLYHPHPSVRRELELKSTFWNRKKKKWNRVEENFQA
jgi:hypothetical protein